MPEHDKCECRTCASMRGRVGDRGQRYEVVVRDAETGRPFVVGWQNEPSGGLADAAAKHPSWTDVQVIDRHKAEGATGG